MKQKIIKFYDYKTRKLGWSSFLHEESALIDIEKTVFYFFKVIETKRIFRNALYWHDESNSYLGNDLEYQLIPFTRDLEDVWNK